VSGTIFGRTILRSIRNGRLRRRSLSRRILDRRNGLDILIRPKTREHRSKCSAASLCEQKQKRRQDRPPQDPAEYPRAKPDYYLFYPYHRRFDLV